MRFDLHAFRRNSRPEGQAGTATEEPPKATDAGTSPSAAQSESTNRIEALLRAHPSIVHEID